MYDYGTDRRALGFILASTCTLKRYTVANLCYLHKYVHIFSMTHDLCTLQVLLTAILLLGSNWLHVLIHTYIFGAPKIMMLTFTQGLDWWLFSVGVEVLVKVCSSPTRGTFIELFTKLSLRLRCRVTGWTTNWTRWRNMIFLWVSACVHLGRREVNIYDNYAGNCITCMALPLHCLTY